MCGNYSGTLFSVWPSEDIIPTQKELPGLKTDGGVLQRDKNAPGRAMRGLEARMSFLGAIRVREDLSRMCSTVMQ